MAIENGTITRPAVIELFNQYSNRMETKLTNQIDSLLEKLDARSSRNDSTTNAPVVQNTIQRNGSTLWQYKGKFWMVPKYLNYLLELNRKALGNCGFVVCL